MTGEGNGAMARSDWPPKKVWISLLVWLSLGRRRMDLESDHPSMKASFESKLLTPVAMKGWCSMWRGITIGACFAVFVVGAVSGQSQRSPATLDDLLTEMRGMRGDINRAASASVRAELLTARVTLQELRLSTAAQQLANVRQQLAESRLRLAPSTEQIKPAMETTSQILAPLRYTVQQEQQRNRVLQNEEAALMRLIQGEENRWTEFNSRLDDLERALSR